MDKEKIVKNKMGGGTSSNNLELSIIIPVYNVEKYLKECLNSISKIKDINYEILIVNDGSPDNSQKIIEEFCKNNIKAKFFIKENGGLSSARNYGIERAKGEYVWFVDSDDFINPDEFQNFYNKLDKNLDILIGNFYIFKTNNISKEEKLLKNNKELSGKELLVKKGKTVIGKTYVWRNLYNREFLLDNKLYFKEKIVVEDQLFTILCLLKAKKVKYLDNYIYYYRIREGSITTAPNRELFAKSSYKICEELLKSEKEINNLYWVKQMMFSQYTNYMKYFKKRDFELEKRLWNLKGMFLVKLEKKYKIWRFFRKLK
ncbi:glycosyltransferase [Fusobacterium perfoetens]|uniref:glycosyltransferase n=1 Tax=Fusobacterium perfoetens TaxID=852 RepID=UPI001F37A2B1|nr:glycosyltransferase [Fusobacterium perfoetens]MCF2612354.1 glycosyltransferase [Fusobacterium perfoetens]